MSSLLDGNRLATGSSRVAQQTDRHGQGESRDGEVMIQAISVVDESAGPLYMPDMDQAPILEAGAEKDGSSEEEEGASLSEFDMKQFEIRSLCEML